MKRTTVALFAALEALVTAAIGIGISLVPLTVLWAVKYNLQVSWLVFWRASVDTWLLGHGVNLTISLPAATATGLGLPGAAAPFQLTIAALGFALLTVTLGVRAGLRTALTPYRQTGVVFAILSFGVIATAVTLSAESALVRPSLWQGILLPMFVFGIGIVIGVLVGSARLGDESASEASRAVRERFTQVSPAVRQWMALSLRGGTIGAALVIAASAVLLAGLIATHFGDMVGLYERLQSGSVGGAALTIGQLAFLPNLVIWTASWLIGPGFAIGAGSSVSPLGTQVGLLPTVPVFGALPQGQLTFGFVGLVVPVLAGFVAALLVAYRRRNQGEAPLSVGSSFLVALGIGSVAGIQLGLLAWWSSGAVGPGRLHTAGPDPWMTGLIAAAEVAVAAILGMITGGRARQ